MYISLVAVLFSEEAGDRIDPIHCMVGITYNARTQEEAEGFSFPEIFQKEIGDLFGLQVGNFYIQLASERDRRRVLGIIQQLIRPGQTVFFKGIVFKADDDKAEYGVAPKTNTTVQFQDANYQKIAALDFTTNDYGSFTGSFTVPGGVLIRDGDYFITLGGRTRKARQLGADMFISVHADSVGNRDVSGSSVYVLSLRGASDEPEAAPRPDLTLVFDQVAYYPPGKSLFYFMGGLTAVYDVAGRRWSDLRPRHTPPPVMGASASASPTSAAHACTRDSNSPDASVLTMGGRLS